MIKILQRFLHWCTFTLRKRHSRTVRYAFPLMFTTLTLIGAALILPTNASYIRIVSDTTRVVEGEQFSVSVYAGAHIPINAVNIELTFPTESMKVSSIDTGRSVITLWTEEPHVSGNKVVFSGGTYRKGFLGEHLIGTIDFRALTDGEAKFTTNGVEMYAGDGTGKKVSVTHSGGESLVVEVITTEDGALTGKLEIIVVTDIDGDGEVGMSDILKFMSAWRNKNVIYDFNADNRMNFVDFAIILADSFYK